MYWPHGYVTLRRMAMLVQSTACTGRFVRLIVKLFPSRSCVGFKAHLKGARRTVCFRKTVNTAVRDLDRDIYTKHTCALCTVESSKARRPLPALRTPSYTHVSNSTTLNSARADKCCVTCCRAQQHAQHYVRTASYG